MTPVDTVSDGREPGGPGDRLLSWRKVREITDLSRSTAWRRQKAGDFPLAVRISPGRVGWWESEVDRWKASRTHRPDVPAARSRPRPPAEPHHPEPPAIPLQNTPAPPRSAPVAGQLRARGRKPQFCEGQIAFEF